MLAILRLQNTGERFEYVRTRFARDGFQRQCPSHAGTNGVYDSVRLLCAPSTATPFSPYAPSTVFASHLPLESETYLHSPVSRQHLKLVSTFHLFIKGLSPLNHIKRRPSVLGDAKHGFGMKR